MSDHKSFQVAILYALTSAFLGAAVNALTKLLGSGVDPLCIIFIRNLITLVGILPFIFWKNHKPKMNREELSRHAPRAIIGLASNICLIYAVQHLPLSSANAISLSQPLFVVFLAPVFLKEHFSINKLVLAVIGSIGVLLILQPNASMNMSGAIISCLHPFLYALMVINVRYLSRYARPIVMIFYYSSYTVLFTIPWAMAGLANLDAKQWMILLAIGLGGLSFQYTQIKSLELAEASAITPFNYIALLWSILFAVIFWREWPDAWAWLGMALVVGMGLALNFMARRKKIIV